MRVKLRIPVIAGPTAVGKTELSLRLAEDCGCEIVSADSRQVYRELSIGTAKPSEEQRKRVPHHFVHERTLEEPFSAGRFAAEATERIGSILARGRTPLVVGGSTLYLQALIYGLADIPDVPAEVRRETMERLAGMGPDALYAELQAVDPAAAATMDPTKSQRLVRALEVYRATGTPLSEFHRAAGKPPYSFRTLVLNRDRKDLYRRIDARTDRMLLDGLLDEVRAVLESGFSPELNALRTIGYREAIEHLQGRIDFDEMRRLIARNTRRYAKRQLTWFRRFPEYAWIDADASYEDVRATLFGETPESGRRRNGAPGT